MLCKGIRYGFLGASELRDCNNPVLGGDDDDGSTTHMSWYEQIHATCSHTWVVIAGIDPQLVLFSSKHPHFTNWACPRVREPDALMLVLSLSEHKMPIVYEMCM